MVRMTIGLHATVSNPQQSYYPIIFLFENERID